MTIATDTLQIAKQLKTLEFTDKQAEGLAEVMRHIDDANKSELVTRDYLSAELKALENRLIVWMIGLVVALGGLMIATRLFT